MIKLPDDISIHVFKGAKLMDIYSSTTGFPRLDNEMLKHEDSIDKYMAGAEFDRLGNQLLTNGADRDGDFVLPDVNDETRFRFIMEEMVTLYSRKNADYGDAFTESLDEDGLLVSKIRIKDKLNRFSQLINNDALVYDETMRDTLIDLANYTVMTLVWLDKNE